MQHSHSRCTHKMHGPSTDYFSSGTPKSTSYSVPETNVEHNTMAYSIRFHRKSRKGCNGCKARHIKASTSARLREYDD